VLNWNYLSKHDFRRVGLPPRKIFSFLYPIKYDLDLKTLVTYCIPRERENVYVGQTGHTFETRVNEHYCHISLHQTEESVVVEHIADLGHHILTKKSRYRDWLMQEVIKFKLHHNNMIYEGRFSLSRSWKALIPF
jgi:hypothetical protein